MIENMQTYFRIYRALELAENELGQNRAITLAKKNWENSFRYHFYHGTISHKFRTGTAVES